MVYPKDQALIVGLTDIRPGMTVVEAGAGSGALTCALLDAVGADGRVISFELRDDHADVAQRNVARRYGGAPSRWTLRRGDVIAGLTEVSCHRIVLDLLEPWEVVKAATGALHPGGLLCAYTPTVPPDHAAARDAVAGTRGGATPRRSRRWCAPGTSPGCRCVRPTAWSPTPRS